MKKIILINLMILTGLFGVQGQLLDVEGGGTISGNLGVGIEDAFRRLHVKSGEGTSIVARIESQHTNGTTIDFKDPNTTGDWLARIGGKGDGLLFIAGGAERMNILDDGKIGLGVSAPTTKLEIRESKDDDYTYTLIGNTGNGGAGLWLSNISNTSTGSSKVIFRNANANQDGAEYWALGNDKTDENKFKIHPHTDMQGASTFVIDRTAKVGIGTPSPSQKLEVREDRDDNYTYTLVNNAGNGGTGLWLSNPNNSTGSSKVLFRNANASQDGAEYWAIGNDKTDGNKFKIAASSSIEGSSGFVFDRSGRLGLGTNDIPSGYKLAIDGKSICEEVWVKNSTNWPDYVFEKDYDLLPLSKVEQHIQQEGHLPNIPSAMEVEEGFALAEMDKKLLEKVEELTLYVIQADKENKELREELEVTKAALSDLQKQFIQFISNYQEASKTSNQK